MPRRCAQPPRHVGARARLRKRTWDGPVHSAPRPSSLRGARTGPRRRSICPPDGRMAHTPPSRARNTRTNPRRQSSQNSALRAAASPNRGVHTSAQFHPRDPRAQVYSCGSFWRAASRAATSPRRSHTERPSSAFGELSALGSGVWQGAFQGVWASRRRLCWSRRPHWRSCFARRSRLLNAGVGRRWRRSPAG